MVNYEKKLNYFDLLLASIGDIVGAGIFFLIQYVYNYAEEKTWLSILLYFCGNFEYRFPNININKPPKNIDIHVFSFAYPYAYFIKKNTPAPTICPIDANNKS